MPRQPLSEDECVRLLAREALVRVAFHDETSLYLIPLGYVWLRGALHGVTERGRKTRVAEANSNVAFQVDSSAHTGLWKWDSVTGEGSFELVASDAEKQQVLSGLQPVVAQAPEWWRQDQAARIAAGTLLVWKIVPTRVSGCRYAPSWSVVPSG